MFKYSDYVEGANYIVSLGGDGTSLLAQQEALSNYLLTGQMLPVYNKSANQPPYPLIQVQTGVKIRHLKISDMYRKEYIIPVETIRISDGGEVDSLILENISTENHTQEANMPILVNDGIIRRLDTKNIMENGKEIDIH